MATILPPSGLARRRVLCAMASAATLVASAATAQPASPSTPLKLVVGYAAGGPVDSAARMLAPLLSKELGQVVIVENRPGAGGAVGGASVVKASRNGHELFFAASPTMTISPHVLKSMSFDPVKDLQPVAPILNYANVLVINRHQPFRTVPELIAFAKTHPGQLAFGSAGMGGSNHLSGELFARRTHLSMTHVPYKGNAPAMADVIGGQVSMMFDIIGSAKTYIDSEKVRALAVTSRERNPALPNIPSLAELGVQDFDVGGWYGLFGPVGLNADAAKRIASATTHALTDPDLRKRWADLGYVIWNGTAMDLAERTRRDLALWGDVTRGMSFE